MDKTNQNKYSPYSCSFVLLSCKYGPEINQNDSKQLPSQITLKFSETQDKLFLQKYGSRINDLRSTKDDNNFIHNSQSMNLQSSIKQSHIPTKKNTYWNAAEVNKESYETLKKDMKNRISLKQRARKNSSSLCELVQKLENQHNEKCVLQSYDQNKAGWHMKLQRQRKQGQKKQRQRKQGQKNKENNRFMNEKQFKEQYNRIMKDKLNVIDKKFRNQQKPIQELQKKNKQKKTFQISDNGFSFTQIRTQTQMNSKSTANKLSDPKRNHKCSSFDCKSGKNLERKKQKAQTINVADQFKSVKADWLTNQQKTSIIMKKSTQKSQQENQLQIFQTLCDISKNVESIREKQSEQSRVSMVMSYQQSANSQISSNDGSKLYRTIKRLTSKNISQVS